MKLVACPRNQLLRENLGNLDEMPWFSLFCITIGFDEINHLALQVQSKRQREDAVVLIRASQP